MDYEGQICRAPMERSSFMLPVMVGCSYNQCKFCNLFRHLKYRELPMEQIEAELKRVRELHGKPKKIFLGDGNAFGLKTEKLYEILDLKGLIWMRLLRVFYIKARKSWKCLLEKR